MQRVFAGIDESQATPDIPGLSYHPNYIDPKVESELVDAIDHERWDTTWKRRRQPYGAAYGKQDGSRRPIPKWAQSLLDRLYEEGLSDQPFDQMLVNEY